MKGLRHPEQQELRQSAKSSIKNNRGAFCFKNPELAVLQKGCYGSRLKRAQMLRHSERCEKSFVVKRIGIRNTSEAAQSSDQVVETRIGDDNHDYSVGSENLPELSKRSGRIGQVFQHVQQRNYVKPPAFIGGQIVFDHAAVDIDAVRLASIFGSGAGRLDTKRRKSSLFHAAQEVTGTTAYIQNHAGALHSQNGLADTTVKVLFGASPHHSLIVRGIKLFQLFRCGLRVNKPEAAISASGNAIAVRFEEGGVVGTEASMAGDCSSGEHHGRILQGEAGPQIPELARQSYTSEVELSFR
jgi:hypothetical protein